MMKYEANNQKTRTTCNKLARDPLARMAKLRR